MSFRRSIVCSGFAWISASVVAGPIFAANLEYSVHGKLVAQGGQSITGALVSAAPLPEGREAFAARFGEIESPAEAGRTRSGQDGAFDLVLPAEGFYRIQIRAESFLPVEQRVLVPSPEPVVLPLVPLRPARRLRLAVEDPDGRKLAGARIRVEGPGGGGVLDLGEWQAFAVTGEAGIAELDVPASSSLKAYAVSPGLAAGELRVGAGAGQATLRLRAGSPQPVEVVDASRRPLPGITVFPAEARLPIGITGKDGKAVLRVGPEQKSFGFADAAGREGLALLRPTPGDPAVSAPRLRIELADPRPLRGQVVEKATRQPVEGAWVFAGMGSGTSAARSGRGGYFELGWPREGVPTVSAIKAGYRQGGAHYGETAEAVEIELEPGARLEGLVVDAAGRPVAGASLLAITGDGPFEHGWPSFGVSRRDGGFALADLPPGAVQIKAISGKLASPVVKTTLVPSEPASVELVLPSPAGLAVRVLDPRGQAVGQAEVFGVNRSDPRPTLLDIFEPTVRFDDEMSLLGTTDTEGNLRLGDLSPGSYDLAARVPLFAPAVLRKVAVGAAEAGDGKEVELKLRPAGQAKGRVIDDAGEGVVGAALYLTVVPDDPNSDRLSSGGTPAATSGTGGEFLIAGVDPERRFHLVVSKEGYVQALQRNVTLDERQPLWVRLQRGASIAGNVLAAGRLPGSILVELAPEEDAHRQHWWDTLGRNSAQPDAAGRYAFDQVAPGRYRLAVKHVRGYQPFEGEAFDLRAGETRIEDIELRKAAAIDVRVLLPDGEPAVRAAVSFVAEKSDQAGIGYGVDSAGRFRDESATPGSVWLRVRNPGYPELLRQIEVLPGENALELMLEAGAIELEARVADREGAPIAGARAMLAGPNQNEATSDTDGRIRFSGLDNDTYRLRIDKDGYLFQTQDLAVETSRQDLEWTLERAAFRLKGAVLGLAEGCAELDVWVMRRDHGPASGRCENGAYLVEGLVAGKSTLIATHAGSRVVVRTIEIPPRGADETELDLDFRTLAGPWSGRLRLGEHDLRNVRYSLDSGLGALLSGFSADGRIELYADPGRYLLSVMARPMEESKRIEIEIGSPSEQLIDASEP